MKTLLLLAGALCALILGGCASSGPGPRYSTRTDVIIGDEVTVLDGVARPRWRWKARSHGGADRRASAVEGVRMPQAEAMP